MMEVALRVAAADGEGPREAPLAEREAKAVTATECLGGQRVVAMLEKAVMAMAWTARRGATVAAAMAPERRYLGQRLGRWLA